jgi:hypothetical protein
MNRPCKPALPARGNLQVSRGLPGHNDNGAYIVYDVPGSVCEARFFICTTAQAINPAGTVTGLYADANGAPHGYVRANDGTFTLFDGPGATTTWPTAINPSGVITGFYCDDDTCHAFLRAPDGTLTNADPPDSVLTFVDGRNISPEGALTGQYYDADFNPHCFLRNQNGTFVTFDLSPFGGEGMDINANGEIVGSYYDEDFNSHGFLRSRDGTITTIDPPGSIFTEVLAIAPDGTMAGDYVDDQTFATLGFRRSPKGAFTDIDGPGSNQTYATSINPGGLVTGNYYDATSSHGFSQTKQGDTAIFDPSGSVYTYVHDINPGGVIVGSSIDALALEHGFIRIPR